ncbi:MAG: type IVB secretion system coupling complex protein DotM/IcmP [Gammaproteobacteria bacterium]|nr:type IVB secretion system coupling complex protein DotM/IcmP [Gammaproteobacteria bacterium]
MAAAPQQGQGEGTAGILWVSVAFLATIAVIWFAFKNVLITYYFKLKLFEISLISYFTDSLNGVRYDILSANANKITFPEVLKLGEQVGNYLVYPCIAIIVILAITVYFTNSVRSFKRTYDMKALATSEQVNWPQISPVVKLDLVKTNIDTGPWAMALAPMAFCKKNNLLVEHKRAMQEGMTRKDLHQIDVTLKRGIANKIFATQLGPLWAGTQRLPPHMKALFAIFAARLNGDGKAMDMLKQLNVSCTTKLNFSGTDQLCKKHESTKLVQQIVNSHAYVLTVMASMLVGARTDGVQASADFLWLKPVDRRLWYVLNTVGRQTPFCEVAGVFAHWVAEREMGKPLIVPMIEEATNALEKALSEIVYKPDEE